MNKNFYTFIIILSIVIIFFGMFFMKYYTVFYPEEKSMNEHFIIPEEFEGVPPDNLTNNSTNNGFESFQSRPTPVNDPTIDFTPSVSTQPNTYYTDTMDENKIDKFITVLREGMTDIGKGTYISVNQSFTPLKVNNINNLTFSFWIQINTTFQKHDLTIIEFYSHSTNTPLGNYPSVIRFNSQPAHTGLSVRLNNSRQVYNIPPRYIVRGRWVNITLSLSDKVLLYVGGEKVIDAVFPGIQWFYPQTLITLPHFSNEAGDIRFSKIKLIPLAVKPDFVKNNLLIDYPVLEGNPGLDCYMQNKDKSESERALICSKFMLPTVPNKFNGKELKLTNAFKQPTDLMAWRVPSFKVLDGKLIVFSGMAEKKNSGFVNGYLSDQMKFLPGRHIYFPMKDQFGNNISFYMDFKGIIVNNVRNNRISLNNLYYGISAYFPLSVINNNWTVNYVSYNIASDLVYLTGNIIPKQTPRRNQPIKIADIPGSIQPPKGSFFRWNQPNGAIQLIDNVLEYLPNNNKRETIYLNQINWSISKGELINAPGTKFLTKYNKFVPMPDLKITLYEHANYQGKFFEFGPGRYDINNIRIGNDQLSSVAVPEGMEVILYENAGFRGKSFTIRSNKSRLSEYILTRPRLGRRGTNWNDKMSSFIVRRLKEGDNIEVDIGTSASIKAYKFGDFVKLSGSVIMDNPLVNSREIGMLPEKYCPNMYLVFQFESYKITIWRNGGILLEVNPFKRPINNAYSLDEIIYWMGVEEN